MLKDKILYIEIYNLSFLNPFSIKSEINFRVEKGFKEIGEIYIKSGEQQKLIWKYE